MIDLCGVCGRRFILDKFHPYQMYCSSYKCQRERKRKYLHKYGRVWRKLHPDYSREYWSRYRRDDTL